MATAALTLNEIWNMMIIFRQNSFQTSNLSKLIESNKKQMDSMKYKVLC